MQEKIRKNFIQLKHYSSTNYYIVSLTTTTYCKIHNNGLLSRIQQYLYFVGVVGAFSCLYCQELGTILAYINVNDYLCGDI